MQGLVLKGIGSFYTVLGDDGTEYTIKARGRFRKEGISPVVGDCVTFDVVEGNDGYMTDILERKNLLIRPSVANIDKLITVISASHPQPDFLMLDKLILRCEQLGIAPVIVLNKCDSLLNDPLSQYRSAGYQTFMVSALTGEGVAELKTVLEGSICCFAGQSAVGKSSLINAIMPQLDLEVGGLSRKTSRGKHTTRSVSLIPFEGGGALLDTPGFSLIDTEPMEAEDLSQLYPEMRRHLHLCRFAGCLHVSEPDCGVKDAVKSGEISKERYERYKLLLEEIKRQRKHRYD